MSDKQQRSPGYTRICNSVFQDKRLNEADVGLLCFMLSLPPDWKFSVAGLCAVRPQSGRSKLSASIKHLEQAGYLQRTLCRENGKVAGCIWKISDVPFENLISEKPLSENLTSENLTSEKPSAEKPSAEKPSADFQPQTNNLSNKILTNKILSESHYARAAREGAPSVPLCVEEVKNYCSETGLAMDAAKFYDHYTAKGWIISGDPVHDWKALARNWARRDEENANISAAPLDYGEPEDFYR